MGCLFGGYIGDSSGSLLEFSTKIIDENILKTALKMPGGGPHKVAPGQVTDDSELSICLLKALKKGNGILDRF